MTSPQHPPDVTDAYRRLALPYLRDWLRSNRTGPAAYPLVSYGDYVAELTVWYLHGCGWTTRQRTRSHLLPVPQTHAAMRLRGWAVDPLNGKAKQMVDGIHIAARAAAREVSAGREAPPLDPYSRGVAAKYAGTA